MDTGKGRKAAKGNEDVANRINQVTVSLENYITSISLKYHKLYNEYIFKI